MYVYLMESREQDGIINLNRTDVHFGDEYLGHARRWIDIVIPGFEEGEYEVVYEGKNLGKYTCKGKKQSVSMFDGNPQWVYYIWHMIQEYNEEADDFYYTSEITYKRYFTDGTTTDNSKDYHLMYSQNTYSNGTVSDARFLYRIREEDGRVYIPAEDFNSCYKELSEDIENFHHYPLVGDEYVIYDENYLYILSESDEISDGDILIDNDLSYKYWWLIVLLPNEVQFIKTVPFLEITQIESEV
jgi:hypothetical protein